MLKKMIQHIQQTAQPLIRTVGEETYCITAAGEITAIQPPIDRPTPLQVSSLDALVKMIRGEGVHLEHPLYVTIPTPTKVWCFGTLRPEDRYARDTYYEAVATDVPGWGETVKMGFEEALIALRTRVQDTPDTQYALRLLSEISTGAKVVYNDNGIATTVTTQKGVALQTNEPIRPIIGLRPYRSFQELPQQVESQFLIRVGERGITFVEADGGMWRLAAREAVKDWLCEHLSPEVEEGSVVVAL